MGFLDGIKQFGANLGTRLLSGAIQGARAVESAAVNAVGGTDSSVAKDVFEAGSQVESLFQVSPPPSADLAYDGMLVGANGQTFPPGTPLSSVPAATPYDGLRNDETILYVNGVGEDLAQQGVSMQAAANATGSRVIGVHNATDGFAQDALQTVGDIADTGQDKAVDSLTDTIYGELKAGRGVHIMAHSQGGAETARALTNVQQRLISDGMSPEQAKNAMGAIKVETFAAAASVWPNGPKYVHYVNTADPVAELLGVGQDTGAKVAQAGQGAVIRQFTDVPWNDVLKVHDFNTVYLDHWQPFDQVYPHNA
jgi:hypothetical protein